MRIGQLEIKRRVWVGLAGAAVATIAWWAWSWGTPPPTVVVREEKRPFVRLVDGGTAANAEILRERAGLFDPTPLFFPTEWNYGNALPERLRRKPEQIFGSFGPKPTFGDQDMKLYGGQEAPAPKSLVDLLEPGNKAPFAGLGQIDSSGRALQERSAFIEIRGLGQKEAIINEALEGVKVPRPDFAPLEFIVAISTVGIIGDPILMSSSGSEEVDAFFRTYLVKTFRVGQRLAPGRYRVAVGP